jgi:hypothetical protein
MSTTTQADLPPERPAPTVILQLAAPTTTLRDLITVTSVLLGDQWTATEYSAEEYRITHRDGITITLTPSRDPDYLLAVPAGRGITGTARAAAINGLSLMQSAFFLAREIVRHRHHFTAVLFG